MKHIVALSGGKDSTAMALRLAETEPRDYTYVCTPTGNELSVMKEHWEKLERILGKPLLKVTNDLGLIGLSLQQKCLPNFRIRWCTRLLKIVPYKKFMADSVPATTYVGIRADEADERDGVEYPDESGVITDFPLVRWGWDEADVWDYLAKKGIDIPQRTDCALCFYQRLIEWWNLWHDEPEEFDKGVILEETIGHTFRSAGRDSWPAPLKELKAEFEKGRRPKGAGQLEFDLGVYSRSKMCSICAR